MVRVLLLATALASLAAAQTTPSPKLCTNTASVVLGSCGSACPSEQPCAQYPSGASTKCSDLARNKCEAVDTACTIQCIQAYNSVRQTWNLFVKEPAASDTATNSSTPTDKFPVAPVDQISGYQIPADAKSVQITGFDNVDVQKGSIKNLLLDFNMFNNAKTVTTFALTNIDLSKLPSNLIPTSISTLVMKNCMLSDVPSDLGNTQNLKDLSLAKNTIGDLPSADSKITKALQHLEKLDLSNNQVSNFNWLLTSIQTLDLSDNKLTEFPFVVFNMTKLQKLVLTGNSIKSVSLTSSQLSFLKSLSGESKLGISSTSGSCTAGEKEEKVLDTVVCVKSGDSGAATKSSSSSNNTVLYVCIGVGAFIILVGTAAFFYRRRSKAKSEFYVSVMENNPANRNPTNRTTTSQTGASVQAGRARGGSQQGRSSMLQQNGVSARGSIAGANRESRQFSSANVRQSGSAKGGISTTASAYAEISRYHEELQQRASGVSSIAPGTRNRQHQQINQNVVRINSQDINYTRSIAKGAFGDVWLAHYGRDLVAVKKLMASDATSVGDFIAELNLLASLSHPRILSLIGACWDDSFSDIQIVTEYMDSGDLLTVLRSRSSTELTWENGKAAYCLQICEAIYYLHSLQPVLIHRDIKSRNILIDSEKGAKLSDFGESRERTIQSTMTAGVGTARWVAPEIILGEDYSELADVYSLGVLLTELDTHQIPFESMGLEEHTIVQQVAVGKLRPKVSETCPEVIRRLTHECLQFDPQLRPSAARVLQTLMASPLVRGLQTAEV
ncbi:hypothetical protein PINS_up014118 [Pythium insidiosum]|nr:hypothetical protein PINS_up014118 [Pythium insidiosum]